MPKILEAKIEDYTQSPFRRDQEKSCKDNLKLYLQNKKIPVKLETLFTRDNFRIILEGEFGDKIVDIYKTINAKKKNTGTWDIDFVRKQLYKCYKLKIPKPMAAGIILIYVKLMKKYQEENYNNKYASIQSKNK